MPPPRTDAVLFVIRVFVISKSPLETLIPIQKNNFKILLEMSFLIFVIFCIFCYCCIFLKKRYLAKVHKKNSSAAGEMNRSGGAE